MGRFQWVPRTSVSVNVRHFLESTIYFSDILVRVWESNCQPKYVLWVISGIVSMGRFQ